MFSRNLEPAILIQHDLGVGVNHQMILIQPNFGDGGGVGGTSIGNHDLTGCNSAKKSGWIKVADHHWAMYSSPPPTPGRKQDTSEEEVWRKGTTLGEGGWRTYIRQIGKSVRFTPYCYILYFLFNV